ncbi:MAG: 50S ribosomal protein L32 [Chloroflexi bacterium]|jgi:large subunit ribosomal protein L32|nr:50S ribosomal protein L32 [Chloroflexota bacterium]
MTPLPKRKHSHGRTRRRRSHDALTRVKLVECPSCHAMRLPHRACPACGQYRGMKVVQVEAQS